jgi:hypothetical protein
MCKECHIVCVETVLKDREAIQAACKRRGLPVPVQGKASLFSGDFEGLLLQLPDWHCPAVIDALCGPPHNASYVAKLLMWRSSVFLREIPRDRPKEGHITSRASATETGLAVLCLRDDVRAVFDRYAVVNASQRALPTQTASVSGHLPIQAATLVMWRTKRRESCFCRSRDSRDYITEKAT